MYREKNSQGIKSAGFSGKEIASKLGERWRTLNSGERKNYGLQAFAIRELANSPEKLGKSTSVLKVEVSEPVIHDLITTVSKRRNSF